MLRLKHLLLLTIFPVSLYAQNREAAEKIMTDFYRYYDANQTDSLCTLFHSDLNKTTGTDCTWKEFEAKNLTLANYGLIKALKFASHSRTKEGENIFVYDVVFRAKGPRRIIFGLKENKFNSFYIAAAGKPASKE